jgi:thymidylate synthase
VLLEVVAGLVGVSVGKLHFSIASLHIYDKHWARAEKIAETPNWTSSVFGNVWPGTRFDPRAVGRSLKSFDRLLTQWFKIESKIRSNHEHVDEMIVDFPESMLRSWLWILRWWNTGDDAYLNEIDGTRICASARLGVQPKSKEPRFEEKIVELGEVIEPGTENIDLKPVLGTDFKPPVDSYQEQFTEMALKLHTEKSEAYGDSWKRRGEVLGILANIARKVDRVKSGVDTSDETSADTALDLYVYAAMYRWWLVDQKSAPWPVTEDMGFYNGFAEHPVIPVNTLMRKLLKTTKAPSGDHRVLKSNIDKNFSEIEYFVIGDGKNRSKSDDKHLALIVDELALNALWLAYDLWNIQNDNYAGADVD